MVKLRPGGNQNDQDGPPRGVQVISDAKKFVQQGARQIEIWAGKPTPIPNMQRVVDHALAQQTAANAAEVKK